MCSEMLKWKNLLIIKIDILMNIFQGLICILIYKWVSVYDVYSREKICVFIIMASKILEVSFFVLSDYKKECKANNFQNILSYSKIERIILIKILSILILIFSFSLITVIIVKCFINTDYVSAVRLTLSVLLSVTAMVSFHVFIIFLLGDIINMVITIFEVILLIYAVNGYFGRLWIFIMPGYGYKVFFSGFDISLSEYLLIAFNIVVFMILSIVVLKFFKKGKFIKGEFN